MTVEGTVTDASVDCKVTVVSPAGEIPERNTVPTPLPPPGIAAGLKDSSAGTGRTTASVAVSVVPKPAAEIVTLTSAGTGVVVIAKVADVSPCAMVTAAGSVTLGSELVSVTVTPLAGAGDVSVTVPVLGLPPVTPIGLRLKVLSVGPMSSDSVVSTLSALSTDQ